MSLIQRLLDVQHSLMKSGYRFVDEINTCMDGCVTHVHEVFPFFEKTKVLVIQVANMFLLFPHTALARSEPCKRI
jgi:hypothetical protein